MPVLAVIVDAGIFHHCPASHLSNHVRLVSDASVIGYAHSAFTLCLTEIQHSILKHWLHQHGRLIGIVSSEQPRTDTLYI